MNFSKLTFCHIRNLYNETPVFFSSKRMYSLIFLFFFTSISAQNLSELTEQLESIATNDSNYEKTLLRYIETCKKKKNDQLLFEGYLKAIRWYNDTLIRNTYYDSTWLLVHRLNEVQFKIRFFQTKSHVNFIEKKYTKSLQNQLKALDLIDKQNDPYLYNKALYSIGATKLYMGNYSEALSYFKNATTYFKTQTDLSHVMGYLNCIRSEAICNYYLDNINEAHDLLVLGRKSFHYLDKDDYSVEKAYFELTQAMICFKKEKYQESNQLLTDALPEIVLNEDFANENLIYFYLGKNYWALGNKELAVTYFKKINDLFTKNEYINVHFLKAYTYLIDFYKQKNDLENQLFYTNQLLTATQSFQKTQSYLSDYFHTEFDTKFLKEEKLKLENQIARKHLFLVVISVVGVLLLVSFVILYVRNKRMKSAYKQRYKAVLKQIQDRKMKSKITNEIINSDWMSFTEGTQWNSYIHSKDSELSSELKAKKEILPLQLMKELNEKLSCFETKKMYLKSDFTLNELADYCKTNRSYLSQYINQVKQKSFPDYINLLRVNLLLDDLQTDYQLRNLKTEIIAEKYGYTNRRSFSNAFLKITGITFIFFLQQLEKEGK